MAAWGLRRSGVWSSRALWKPDTTSPHSLPPAPEPGKPSRGSQMQWLEDSEGCQQQCDPLSAAPAGPAAVCLPFLWRCQILRTRTPAVYQGPSQPPSARAPTPCWRGCGALIRETAEAGDPRQGGDSQTLPRCAGRVCPALCSLETTSDGTSSVTPFT